MTAPIHIVARTQHLTEIDIEGIIGVPESEQFAGSGSPVATYRKFRETVENLRRIHSRNIVVNIRSTGGNINDALLIYETLSALPGEITTRCYGYAASAATVIAQAASPGKREISANALYLIHKSSSCTEGNAGELARTLDLLNKTDRRIAAVYAARSGRSPEHFDGLMARNDGNGVWMSPEETLAAGLADRIIAPAKTANDAARIVDRLGLPPIPENLRPPIIDKIPLSMTNIKKRWNALLEILGLNPENDCDASDLMTTEVADSPEKEPETAPENEELARLRNRVAELESMNARLRAEATRTLPREDPSLRDTLPEPNALAYENDLRNLKNR